MTRLAGVAAAALVMVAGGQATAWAQGKTTTYPVVPLSVEVANTTAEKIRGDGGLYENGAPDGTTANIDKYGNLIIKFGREVTFEYGPGASPGLASGDYDNSYISTLNAGGTPLQNLIEGLPQCIKLNWQYDVSGGWLRHGFQRTYIEPTTSSDPSSFAVVTRTESGWLIEPSTTDSCGSSSNRIAHVFRQSTKGKVAFTDYGFYSLPFRLVLTPQ